MFVVIVVIIVVSFLVVVVVAVCVVPCGFYIIKRVGHAPRHCALSETTSGAPSTMPSGPEQTASGTPRAGHRTR